MALGRQAGGRPPAPPPPSRPPGFVCRPGPAEAARRSLLSGREAAAAVCPWRRGSRPRRHRTPGSVSSVALSCPGDGRGGGGVGGSLLSHLALPKRRRPSRPAPGRPQIKERRRGAADAAAALWVTRLFFIRPESLFCDDRFPKDFLKMPESPPASSPPLARPQPGLPPPCPPTAFSLPEGGGGRGGGAFPPPLTRRGPPGGGAPLPGSLRQLLGLASPACGRGRLIAWRHCEKY